MGNLWETTFLSYNFFPLKRYGKPLKKSIACLCSLLQAMACQSSGGTYDSSSAGGAIMKRSSIRTTGALNNNAFLLLSAFSLCGRLMAHRKGALVWETYGKPMGNSKIEAHNPIWFLGACELLITYPSASSNFRNSLLGRLAYELDQYSRGPRSVAAILLLI